jgi:phosphoesterase RecJ-like protein
MDKTLIKEAHELIDQANFIVVTAHKSPDGDSVGSSTAMLNYLKAIGKDAVICFPDAIPFFLNWMTGTDSILRVDSQRDEVQAAFDKADLVFCLDYNSITRIGDVQGIMSGCDAKKVMIDHHENPDMDFCDVTISYPKACSTAELVYQFIDGAGNKNVITSDIGNSLYCGIMTDTGSFRYPSTSSTTHRIIADLMDCGVKNSFVHEQVFDTNTMDRLKLRSHIMMNSLQLIEDDQIAMISVSQFELTDLNYTKGDTEGLVNQALSINGVRMAIFFKEQDGLIKISFRSKGDLYVNEFASAYFHGGGHKYASGGKFVGKLSEGIDRFVTLANKLVS